MRHKNYYNGRCGWSNRHNKYIPRPYGENLEYKRPSMKRKYCKMLQVIADHPNCKRKELIARIFIDKKWLDEHNSNHAKAWDAGDFSWVKYNPSKYFAELLWADLIDYDEKTFKYHVTEKGHDLLEKAYLNDNIKFIIGKFPWQKR